MGLFNMGSSESTQNTTNYNSYTPTTSGNAPAVTGNGNTTLVNATSESALTALNNAVTGAFNFGGRGLDTVDRAVLNALLSSDRSAKQAIESAQASAREALGSNVTVSSNAMDLTNRAMGTIANSFADSLNFVGHISDLALQQSSRVDEMSAGAVQQVARAYDTATNYQAEKATLDSRYMVVAGMVLIGIVALKVLGK